MSTKLSSASQPTKKPTTTNSKPSVSSASSTQSSTSGKKPTSTTNISTTSTSSTSSTSKSTSGSTSGGNKPTQEKDKSSPKKKTIPTFKFDDKTTEEIVSELEELQEAVRKAKKEYDHQTTLLMHYCSDLAKNYNKLHKKELEKKEKKNDKSGEKRISPEFEVSAELAEFMGLDEGQKTSRTAALSFVSKYIKEHSLNGMEKDDGNGGTKIDGRLINLDDKLEKLFPNLVESGEVLQFTTLIKHLGQHFPKKDE